MNLTEAAHSRTLVEAVLLRLPSAETAAAAAAAMTASSTSWKDVATRIATLALGYGVFFALKRRFYPQQRSVSVGVRSALSRRCQDDGEVCPICLEAPRDGVRPGCGHRLCARCLLRYCEAQLANGKRSRPPPCPLCRMPLVSVTLTCDQPDITRAESNGSDCTVDPATARWIRRFNASGGLPAGHGAAEPRHILVAAALIGLKLVLVALVFALIAKFQIPSRPDLAPYSSFLLTAVGGVALACLWLKCREQAALELDD